MSELVDEYREELEELAERDDDLGKVVRAYLETEGAG